MVSSVSLQASSLSKLNKDKSIVSQHKYFNSVSLNRAVRRKGVKIQLTITYLHQIAVKISRKLISHIKHTEIDYMLWRF